MRVNHHFSLLILVSLLLGTLLGSQTIALAMGPNEDFILQAIGPAQAAQRETSVPTSVTIAQAILESTWGRDHIGAANNYFGIKAFRNADGSVNYGKIAVGWVEVPTKEWDGSKYIEVMALFRKYKSMEDSFHDHAYFFIENSRYSEAMKHADDPKEFARQIHKAGYATDPVYSDKLISLMDSNKLEQYDLKRDAAQFVSQSDYPEVGSGQSFTIYFEVKNTGLGVWRAADNYRLSNPNHTEFGAKTDQTLSKEVKPNETYRWTLQLSAPQQPGKYRTSWMLKHDASSFGPDMFIDVRVTAEAPPESGGLQGFLEKWFARAKASVDRWVASVQHKLEEWLAQRGAEGKQLVERETDKAVKDLEARLVRELDKILSQLCVGVPGIMILGATGGSWLGRRAKKDGRRRLRGGQQ